MKKHTGCYRGFHRSSKAFYSEVLDGKIEITFGMYSVDGGTSGEMSVEWINLAGRLVPRLKAFNDSWSSLSLFTDLISKMGDVDDECITEEDFAKLLSECGFKDLTQYQKPFKGAKP